MADHQRAVKQAREITGRLTDHTRVAGTLRIHSEEGLRITADTLTGDVEILDARLGGTVLQQEGDILAARGGEWEQRFQDLLGRPWRDAPHVDRTPWGEPTSIREMAQGVLDVSTPGHGGLIMSPGRWNSLPPEVRECMMEKFFAEEDCEMPIALALMGLEGGPEGRTRELARNIAARYPRYAPAMPRLEG